jgi:phosphoglycolate phosphatase
LRYAVDENPDAKIRIMAGDRKHDLIGAIANNIQPIGVSYGYGSVAELSDAGAVKIAANPSELREKIIESANT